MIIELIQISSLRDTKKKMKVEEEHGVLTTVIAHFVLF